MTERAVLVTGGTGGIGKAVTKAFLDRGDSAVVTFIVPSEADDLERLVANTPSADRLTLVRADVTEPEGIEAVVAKTVERHGRLEVLAGLVGGWSGGTPIWETDDRRWDRMIELNLRASYLAIKAAAPIMRAARYGRMVFVSSRAAYTAPELQSAYSVAKAGMLTLAHSAAVELRDDGITVNCVVPSIVDTPAARAAVPEGDPTKWVAPNELAAVIAFLCSDQASAITGAAIPVYGKL